MTAKVLTLFILCFSSAAVAEDFTTVNGKEYKEATVTRMASSSKLNRESQRFISPNSQDKFRNGFITTPRRPRHILPSKPLITRHIKSNRKKPNGSKRKPTQRIRPFSSNNRQPRITLTPCRPATTSFRSRRTICFFKSVRRSNPGRSTGRVSLCTTSQIHKSFGYHFSRAI